MASFENNLNIGLTYMGEYAAAGFISGLELVQNGTVLCVSLRSDVPITFKIHTCPTSDTTEKTLFFEKSITAATTFHRKFAMPFQYVQLEVVNTTSTAGSLLLQVCDQREAQFDASTFINSNIEKDTQTNLIRVANDFNTDMVRGLHTDFKKVNIQAIQQHQPSAESTVGILNQNILSIPVADYVFFINLAGTQDTAAGTGARQVSIDYIDSNFDEASATISTGAGGVFTTGITGKAILRATVSQVGTGLVNNGAIVFQDTSATYQFARIETGACVSHSGLYLIPRNHHLIITDAQLQAVGYSGLLRIYEYDYGGIKTRGSIGDFRFSTAPVGQTFRLNGKVDEKKMILVNVIPDVGTPTVNNNVCVNLNAVLCPAINNY